LETDNKISYTKLANTINVNHSLELVLIQHEFGLFKTNEADFIFFLKAINKPIIIVFHTVLPNPDMKKNIAEMNAIVDSFIVMTHASAKLLEQDYGILKNKITVIPHGTHLVKYIDKRSFKRKIQIIRQKNNFYIWFAQLWKIYRNLIRCNASND
jgi:hypothetical protein